MGGALDFAGGTVVHISSGVSALVCALLIGKRVGFGHEDMRPHNLTYTALGAAMLWVGWFGFNAGSELASDNLAASAFCTTHFAAAAGGIAWAFYDWLTRGKPTVLGTASGIVAGLVCITPGAGFVNPMPAIAMGAIAGIVCAIRLQQDQGRVRLRRRPRRLRRSRRRRNARRDPDRCVRHASRLGHRWPQRRIGHEARPDRRRHA